MIWEASYRIWGYGFKPFTAFIIEREDTISYQTHGSTILFPYLEMSF
jgi:hypothetical protein